MAEVIELVRRSSFSSLAEVADKFYNEIEAEQIVCKRVELGDNKECIFIGMEEFYFRASNYVTISVMLTDDGYTQTATIMGAGGGDGLLNFSWGANKSFAKRGMKLLQEMGFELKE